MEIFRSLENIWRRQDEQKIELPTGKEAHELIFPRPGKYLVKGIKTSFRQVQSGKERAGYEFEIIGFGDDGMSYNGTVTQSEFVFQPNFDTHVDPQNPRRDPILIIREPGKIPTLAAPDGRIIVDGYLYENNSQNLIMPSLAHGLTDEPRFTRIR